VQPITHGCGLAPLQSEAHVVMAACRNVLVVFIEISSQKSIGDSLSILLYKSVADNAINIYQYSKSSGHNRYFHITSLVLANSKSLNGVKALYHSLDV